MAHQTFSLAESERCTSGCSRLLVLGASTEASPAIAASGTPAMPRASREAAKVGGTLADWLREGGRVGTLLGSTSSSNLNSAHMICVMLLKLCITLKYSATHLHA